MNPIAPNFHTTIKLHKLSKSIRTTVNWKNAPTYELAKHLPKILHKNLYLQYTHNIHNSIHLFAYLQSINVNKNARICSFDIRNMYIIIPKLDIMNIIRNILSRDRVTIDRFWTEDWIYCTLTCLYNS
jgi:hypothetical protein